MKIIGFSQLRNELSKGNLENWFKTLQCCDYIYIYDQASTDGSKEYYKQFKNTVVIESPTNDFKKELICKSILLKKVLSEHPDVDWIFWIDGDTLVDGRLLRNNYRIMYEVLNHCMRNNIDAVRLGHYNLWRSDDYYRLDMAYHDFNKIGRRVFWRNNGHLFFPYTEGLHHQQEPHGLRNEIRIDNYLIHRGFATDEQLIERYDTYKGFGQSGWDLERLLDEETLTVEKLPVGVIPDWYVYKDNVHPNHKKKIRQIYNELKGIA